MSPYDSGQLDDILSDVKRLLGEDDTPVRRSPPPAPARRQEEAPVRAVPEQPYTGEGRYEWNDPSYTGTYYDEAAPQRPQRPVTPSHASRPAQKESAYDRAMNPPQRRPQSAPQQSVRQSAPAQPARQTRPRAQEEAMSRESRARAERMQEERMQAQKRRKAPPVYDEDEDDEDEYIPVKKKKKKGWIIILLLLLVAFGVYKLLAKQPVNKDASLGARKPGVSTVLIAGTDKDGTRTDTLMLMSLDSADHTASLVSIPRDTLVNGAYAVPKINGVYGINGGGEEGIEMLMQRVGECIGFVPDGYLLVDLDSFVSLVDIMGGVKFNVPVDMSYDDPAQNLSIHLSAGEQKLDGVQAMGLVRFRSGYAAADLERVNVQRDFVSAAADQWISPKVILKTPRLLAWFAKNIETNLSTGNMTWIASVLMRCDAAGMATQTLPGSATYISGGSYYVLSPYDVVETVNASLNPYERDITVDDLKIRS